MTKSERFVLPLVVGFLVTGLVLTYLALVFAPAPPSPPMADPVAFRIFFFHVPLAWSGYLAFGVVFLASVAFLRKRDPRWDGLAASSAEIGVVLTTFALVTGAIWQKAETGYYWRWDDARLFTTFVLWLVYLAYVALRAGTEGEEEARMAAIYGILAFATVPISFFSVRILSSLHPAVGAKDFMTPTYGAVLLVGAIASTLLYLLLLQRRLTLWHQKKRLLDVKMVMGGD